MKEKKVQWCKKCNREAGYWCYEFHDGEIEMRNIVVPEVVNWNDLEKEFCKWEKEFRLTHSWDITKADVFSWFKTKLNNVRNDEVSDTTGDDSSNVARERKITLHELKILESFRDGFNEEMGLQPSYGRMVEPYNSALESGKKFALQFKVNQGETDETSVATEAKSKDELLNPKPLTESELRDKFLQEFAHETEGNFLIEAMSDDLFNWFKPYLKTQIK